MSCGLYLQKTATLVWFLLFQSGTLCCGQSYMNSVMYKMRWVVVEKINFRCHNSLKSKMTEGRCAVGWTPIGRCCAHNVFHWQFCEPSMTIVTLGVAGFAATEHHWKGQSQECQSEQHKQFLQHQTTSKIFWEERQWHGKKLPFTSFLICFSGDNDVSKVGYIQVWEAVDRQNTYQSEENTNERKLYCRMASILFLCSYMQTKWSHR